MGQLENIASIITKRVYIGNMTHANQLSSANVKYEWLVLDDMKLCEAETLDNLDIKELTKYDGQGPCNELWVFSDSRRRDRDRLRGWAGWTLREDNDVWGLVMKRKKVNN